MKVYDKAAWHIDNGENKDDVLKRFSIVFKYLAEKNMLTSEGREILDLGIDSSVSLHERMVNSEGQKLLDSKYDTLLGLSIAELQKQLQVNL